MTTNSTGRRPRLPKWLKITLAVFGVLFVLSAIFGKRPEQQTTPVAAIPPETPHSTAATPATPPVVTYTVHTVRDGAVIELADPAGTTKTVRALGIGTPISSAGGCFGGETAAWSAGFLVGKTVTLVETTASDSTGAVFSALTMPDGTDYSTKALQLGYAKYLADNVPTALSAGLQAAESAARNTGIGLWGAPCFGSIAPAPAVPSVTAPPITAQAKPAPKVTPEPVPAPPVTEAPAPAPAPVYYANCSAARAAGAAPLYAGQPGYSRKLDRDGDGVACE